MEHKIAETNARIDVADVLRGLAVMGIILLHSIEHFNFYSFPEEVPFEWMKFTDQEIWRGYSSHSVIKHTLYLLCSSVSVSIFRTITNNGEGKISACIFYGDYSSYSL